MATTEKELEDQLIEAGNNLLNKPPSSVDELLTHLDKVEGYLSRVEQSPPSSMHNAIFPLTKALVANELLSHSDVDVKVAIASCISEITRITAPEIPYDDEQMKEIFQLIVAAFEKLFDTTNRSYSKRLSILETVAKVRSCVVMLDLECDSLILEMFQHFLNTIRDFHPENVFTSMETIMSMVLEESEDISPEILFPLLTIVKKDNQDALPVTRKLVEKVLANCSSKLKPYLMQTVESMGMSLNDFSKTVSFICQETSDTIEQNVSVSEEHKAIESNLSERNATGEPQVTKEIEIEAARPSEVEDPLVNESAKLVNDISKTKDCDSLVGQSSAENIPEPSRHTTQSSKPESDSLGSKTLKSETKPDRTTKKKRERRKHNFSMQSIEAPHHAQIDGDKENTGLLDEKKSQSGETSNKLPEGSSVGEPAAHSGPGKEIPAKLSCPTASHGEAVKAASPARSQSLPDGTLPKRGRGGPNKKENINQDTDLGSPSEPKVALSSDKVEDEVPPSADIIMKKESEGNSVAEARLYKRSGKRAFPKKASKDESAPQTDVISKDSAPTIDSEAKPLKESVKKVDTSDTVDVPSVKNLGGKAKKARGETISGKGEPSIKSTPELINKNEGLLEETPKTTSKRKRSLVKKLTSEISPAEQRDEKLVGSKIKVWWPKDHTFYEGVVDSFDPLKKRHKVLYVDGEVEILNLSRQRWEFIKENSLSDEEQATDLPIAEDTEKPRNKKAKSDSSTIPSKTDASLKGGKRTSTSKSTVEATNSDHDKSKHDDKLGGKSKDIIQKTTSKSKSGRADRSDKNTTKTGSKSKERTSTSKSDVETTNSDDYKLKDEKLGRITRETIPKAARKPKSESAGKSDEKFTKSGGNVKERISKAAGKFNGETKSSAKSKEESDGKSEENTTKSGGNVKEGISKAAGKFNGETSSTKSKEESDGKSEENTTKTSSKSKIGMESKDDKQKPSAKSKDESACKSEENTTKTGSKSKDGTPKLGSKSKDDTPKTSTKSKDESKTKDKTTKAKTGGKSKDGTSKIASKARDENAGKPKESTTKTASKSRDGTPKLASKAKDEDIPKSTTKSNDETPKADKKPPSNGNSNKRKSSSSKVQESEDLKGKSVDSAKAPEPEIESGKKRRKRVNG